jgi:hypothetical protein
MPAALFTQVTPELQSGDETGLLRIALARLVSEAERWHVESPPEMADRRCNLFGRQSAPRVVSLAELTILLL